MEAPRTIHSTLVISHDLLFAHYTTLPHSPTGKPISHDMTCPLV